MINTAMKMVVKFVCNKTIVCYVLEVKSKIAVISIHILGKSPSPYQN